MGIGHVASEDAPQASALHRLEPHRFSEEADLRVKPEVYQVREPAFLADGIHLGSGVGHPVVWTDDQVWMHSIPAVVSRTSLPPAGASAGVRDRRTADRNAVRHLDPGKRKNPLPLGMTSVLVNHVARAKHDRHPVRTGCCERLVDAGYERVDSHRRCLAPMPVPDVDRDHADAGGVDALPCPADDARFRIARPQFEVDHLRGGGRLRRQRRGGQQQQGGGEPRCVRHAAKRRSPTD